MKIYLAGSCGTDRRTHMAHIGMALRNAGYDVYCPFELQIPDAWSMSQEAWAQKVFEEDIKAIDAADVVVFMSPGRESTAGTNWEQGYAYAKGKRCIVFQYTNKPTSLMSYCGCSSFYSLSEVVTAAPADCASYVSYLVKTFINSLSSQNYKFTSTILT